MLMGPQKTHVQNATNAMRNNIAMIVFITPPHPDSCVRERSGESHVSLHPIYADRPPSAAMTSLVRQSAEVGDLRAFGVLGINRTIQANERRSHVGRYNPGVWRFRAIQHHES